MGYMTGSSTASDESIAPGGMQYWAHERPTDHCAREQLKAILDARCYVLD
jgi:hypothetical protein